MAARTVPLDGKCTSAPATSRTARPSHAAPHERAEPLLDLDPLRGRDVPDVRRAQTPPPDTGRERRKPLSARSADELLGLVLVAVNDEDLLEASLERRDVVEELVPVRVRAEGVDDDDLGAERVLLAEYLHRLARARRSCARACSSRRSRR